MTDFEKYYPEDYKKVKEQERELTRPIKVSFLILYGLVFMSIIFFLLS